MSKLGYPNYHFEYNSLDETLKELKKLNPKKTSQVNDILVKAINGNKDIVAVFMNRNSLSSYIFPTALKYVDVKPCFKKNGKTNKENYWPISILPNLSKVYERLIYNQIHPNFDKLFQNSNVIFQNVLMLITA